MSNFVIHRHFCFVYGSKYTLIMEDVYFKKVFLINDEFRHWTPLVVSESRGQRFNGGSDNFPKSLTEISQTFEKLNLSCYHDDQMISKIDNCPGGNEVQSNATPSKFSGNWENKAGICKKNEDYIRKIFSREDSQMMSTSHLIINVQKPSVQDSVSGGHGKSCFLKDRYNAQLERPKCLTNNSKVVCHFCRQNGDRREFYESHQLKDCFGNVTCPVLWSHVCEICGVTGNKAHTKAYCPVLRAAGKTPPRSAICLKNTPRNSSGSLRKKYF